MYPEKCDQAVVWISRGEEFYLQNSTFGGDLPSCLTVNLCSSQILILTSYGCIDVAAYYNEICQDWLTCHGRLRGRVLGVPGDTINNQCTYKQNHLNLHSLHATVLWRTI